MTKTITLKRVIYGKKSTPLEDREYSLTIGGAVGTKKEWIEDNFRVNNFGGVF